MALSAIDIINDATAELGLPTVTTSTAGPDDLGPQMLSLLNALCKELLTLHDWQFLIKAVEYTAVGDQEFFDLPNDYARQVNQTQWDASNRRPLIGPKSPREWGWCQYGLIGTGIFYRYRIVNDQMQIFPPVADGEKVAFYYISNGMIQDGTNPNLYKSRITSDEDKPLFDERVLVSGLKVKLWSIKGLDSTNLQKEASDLLAAYKAQSQGAAQIDLSGGGREFLVGYGNVPDGTYYGN